MLIPDPVYPRVCRYEPHGRAPGVREVPINDSIRIVLRDILKVTPRGQKLFVAPGDKTHLAIHRLESFINYYQGKTPWVRSSKPISFHGLRQCAAAPPRAVSRRGGTCAAEWYDGFLRQGCSELEARKRVSKLLGHTRDDVTRIYLASRLDGGRGDPSASE